MKVKVVTLLACDFCGKTQDEVKSLIKGPRDIAICDECVKVCVETLAGIAESLPRGDDMSALNQLLKGPAANSCADRVVQAIVKHGPITVGQGIALHGKFYDSMAKHMAVLHRAQEFGWIDLRGNQYILTPAMQRILDAKNLEVPAKYVGEVATPPYRPQKEWSGKYDISKALRREELREVSVKTGSCGSNSLYWGNGL